MILRFKNSLYTFSIICIRNPEKKQLKITFIFQTQLTQLNPAHIFQNPSYPAKPSSQCFKTQLTQLNPAYNFSKPSLPSSNPHKNIDESGLAGFSPRFNPANPALSPAINTRADNMYSAWCRYSLI